jgi:hypothetical protein
MLPIVLRDLLTPSFVAATKKGVIPLGRKAQ